MSNAVNACDDAQRILLAIDDQSIATAISEQLQNCGYSYHVCKEQAAFTEAVKNDTADALIIDFNFPYHDGNGILLAQDLQSELGHIPPLIFTYENHSIDACLQCVRANGQGLLIVPDEIPNVIDMMDNIFGRPVLDPYRVLIVQGESSSFSTVGRVLEHSGMTVQYVKTPMAILGILVEFQPDIILMDIVLPNCSGVQLAKVIRQQRNFTGIPIVFLSDQQDIQEQYDALMLGGDDFIPTPIKPSHITSTIKRRAERARQLRALMIRDSLTGLLNHTSILQQLDVEIERARREDQSVCFAMVDIDHFKSINDTYGHPMGDQVIKTLSRQLQKRLRRSDSIGRYGGEEFAIILPNTKQHDAFLILNELLTAFRNISFLYNAQTFSVSFSCGILEVSSENSNEVKEKTDQLLYQAKIQGRNCIVQSQ